VRADQCSDEEKDILRQIIALGQRLPGPLTQYTQALGEIREKEFGIPGRKRHRQEIVERRR
jgi:hypothetical protein